MENKYNINYEGQAAESASAFAVLMRNVYTWMAGGLGLTALVSYLVASNESIVYIIASTPVLLWGLLFGELAMVFILSSRIMKMSFRTAMFMFLGYSVLNGVTMSFIFYAYSSSTIAQAFLITAGTFAGMSILGYTTKTDLSTFGQIMYMALIGLVIATVVNVFWTNSSLAMFLNYAGVLIFVGLTAFDTQKIKTMLQLYHEAGITDQNNKIALMGSLSLYLDFINLFMYVLRILGNRK